MLEIALVGSLLICTLGWGGGGLRVTCSACRWPAVHWLGVSRACGPLARRSAGRRSTQARPRFGGVSKKRKQALQDPALAGSPSHYILICHYAN